MIGVLVSPGIPSVEDMRVANAAGSPDVNLEKEMPAEELYVTPIQVSLVLTNPAGPDGFNALFTDILPEGVTYVDGSGDPAPTVEDLSSSRRWVPLARVPLREGAHQAKAESRPEQ